MRRHRRPNIAGSSLVAAAVVAALAAGPLAAAEDEPLMRDFIGINMHAGRLAQLDPADTPQTYRPVAGLVRLYHPFGWDVEKPGSATNFPYGRWPNWPNWDTGVYRPLADAGYQINAAITFSGFGDVPPDNGSLTPWGEDPEAEARAYGEAFARAFAPPGAKRLVHSIQIGNEPGHMTDELFKKVYRGMAEGIRSVNPDVLLVTPNVHDSESAAYHKNIRLFDDMLHLVDVFATHSYPTIQGWPTWERSYPEDPAIEFLKSIQDVIDHRDAAAPGKQVWVTEFGYDATTKDDADKPFPWEQWVDVTDTQQAQYLTRGFLAQAAMDLDRSYMYWYNDDDTPQFHGSSGITRGASHEPKPSYWALKHLQATLGDYRLDSVVEESDTLRVYAFAHETDPENIIWVVWSPTDTTEEALVTLDGLPTLPAGADLMPLAEGAAPNVEFETIDADSIRLNVGGSPTYLRMHVPEPGSLGAMTSLGALLLARRRRERARD